MSHSPDPSDTFIEHSDANTQVPMEEYYMDNLLPLIEGGSLANSESSNPDSSPPITTPKERDLTTLRRSKRLQALHQLHYIRRFEQTYPNEISLLRYCFQTEVEHPESGMNPADFLPTPEGWRQIP